MKNFDAIVEWCIASLESDPTSWDVDECRAKHKNGVSVWIANAHYGMSIQYDYQTLGGVTGWSSFFGPLIPWRRRLRAAVLALPHYPKPLDEVILAVLRR